MCLLRRECQGETGLSRLVHVGQHAPAGNKSLGTDAEQGAKQTQSSRRMVETWGGMQISPSAIIQVDRWQQLCAPCPKLMTGVLRATRQYEPGESREGRPYIGQFCVCFVVVVVVVVVPTFHTHIISLIKIGYS